MDDQLTIRLPRELASSLTELSEATGLKRADVVRAALRDYLAEHGVGPRDGKPADLVRDLLGSVALRRRTSSDRDAIVARIRRHAVRA